MEIACRIAKTKRKYNVSWAINFFAEEILRSSEFSNNKFDTDIETI